MMICIQGIGASLTRSTEALDVVDGLDPIPNIQPWASVSQQTLGDKLGHQDVPEYFQKDETMKHTIEILERRSPTDNNLYAKRYL